MKSLNFLFYIVIAITILTGCSDENTSSKKNQICPECHMPLPSNDLHTAYLEENEKKIYFDDLGCLILYTHKKKTNLKRVNVQTFASDTERFINPFKGYYRIDEKTPMMYGFSAYENKIDDSMIDFNEVTIKMLRGEHMGNPKIRKQLLGY